MIRTVIFLIGLALAELLACSSNIDLQPLDPDMSSEGLDPGPPEAAVTDPGPTDITTAPNAGDQTAGGELNTPMQLAPAGMGGSGAMPAGNGEAASAGGSSGSGASDPQSSRGGAGGPPPCPDADTDGRCDAVDLCPNDRDDGSDRDADGTPDACDRCPDVARQDDTRDIDVDGTPDACDPCGIGVPLSFSPLFYFPLDEAGASATVINLGSVPQTATYVGPVQRGLAGVADPAGRAIRLVGQANGEFSRVTLLNAAAFPSTALTASFWIRTSQTGDYSILSYAIPDSSNEFGVVVEGDRIRLTLQTSTFEADDVNPALITDGTWHFVALTWNQTRAQFYFDGEAVGSPLITEEGYEIVERIAVPVEGPLELSPGGALVLGQDQDSVNGGFSAAQALNGGLDEVAIFDRVLTAEQIRSIYTGTTCGERCDGIDNDADGKLDEGFLGSAPACGAPSCDAILASGAAFGSGDYFSSINPAVPLTCNFF